MSLRVFTELLFDFQPDSYFTKYQIGDDPNKIIELKNTRFISGVGDQYLVFSYLDYVIKILRTRLGKKELVNEANLKSLSKKKTKRIFMPEELVYDTRRGVCCGHTMPFIGDKKSIINESVDHFLDEIALIWKDANYLSDELILLKDFNDKNYIYNGAINVIDCGQYNDCSICMSSDVLREIDIPEWVTYDQALEIFYNKILNNIIVLNNERINKLILTVLLGEYVYEDSEQMAKYIKHLMEETKLANVDDFIESTKEPDMTVNEYVQHFAKRLHLGG